MVSLFLFLLPWISLALGVGVLLSAFQALFFWKTAPTVMGRVVENREDFEGHTPIIAFSVQGKEYRFPVVIHRGSEPWPIGSERLVRYRAGNPSQAGLDDSLHRWRSVFLFALPAVILFILWLILPRLFLA